MIEKCFKLFSHNIVFSKVYFGVKFQKYDNDTKLTEIFIF